ncbi:MAG: hypothetical protein DIZ80_06745 [endosymbiont of Galathealinum brachiosum]|uniref:diguanylate cyclase n=1 Tax=endosymbiont of Galathealinum brachiosum TaxID=2200906 RepID=A0A370DFX9_9GAMM|nr:MAG: hypothetical protein DIZ80_06745 [endosymbiont of Galathealinum brachiosum]
MKTNKIKPVLFVGLISILILMAASIRSSLEHMSDYNKKTSSLITQNNLKTQYYLALQTSIYHRHISIRNLYLLKDEFDQDDEIMRFRSYATDFIKARDQLLLLNLSKGEIKGLDKLLELVKAIQPEHEKILESIKSGEPKTKILSILEKRIHLQDKIVESIEQIIHAQKIESQNIINNIKHEYRNTKNTIYLIYLASFLLVVVISYLVLRKTQKLEDRLIKANKNLEQLATKDSLTGLYNRRQFNHEIESDWLHCSRGNTPLSVIMIDVDNFKQYNDAFGHVRGDNVLRKIGMKLGKVVQRETDIVARYGGEEFVAVLPSTSQEYAAEIAYKILQSVRDLNIKHVSENEIVTVSIGLATKIPNHNTEYMSIVESADEALYQAKEMGRNQIYIKKDN